MMSAGTGTEMFKYTLLLCTFAMAAGYSGYRFGRATSVSSSVTKAAVSTTSHEVEKTYNSGLVVLELVGGAGNAAILKKLENDEIISQACSVASGKLLIHIVGLACSNSDIASYISEVYSRTWDEIVLHKRYGLECTVASDNTAFGSNAAYPLVDIIEHHSPDFIYIPKHLSHLANIEDQNNDNNNKHIIDFYDGYEEKNLESSVSYHFADAIGESIPVFKRMAIGGTFDRIHNGHKKLLTLAALLCSEQLTIGVSGDALLKNKKGANLIASQQTRMENVRAFIEGFSLRPELNIVPINDPFGPTITDENIEAIIVSSETIKGATKINEKRREAGMKPLSVIVSRRGDMATLSSTFLRSISD
jgi:cytidyltransferase-like protein